MIEMYEIITDKQEVIIKFNVIPTMATRGNIYKIRQDHVKYDLHKYSFSNRVTIVWNNLPDTVVKAESVNSIKNRLGKYWNDHEVKCNWKADIEGTVPEAEVIYKLKS